MHKCVPQSACVQFAQRMYCGIESNEFKKHRAVSLGVYTLAGLIILATMFLKQHSILDTVGACLMAWILYQFVYAPQHRKVPQFVKQKKTAKTSGL